MLEASNHLPEAKPTEVTTSNAVVTPNTSNWAIGQSGYQFTGEKIRRNTSESQGHQRGQQSTTTG
jgi:hypothetical protein